MGRIRAGLVSGVWVLLLFVASYGVVLNVPVVKGDSGTIYIRADGSIDPPTAPITTVDNISYTFADNINDHIVVERSSIVIDGAGYILQGFGTGSESDVGFYLSGINNVIIKNTTIRSFWSGLLLASSSFNTISGNNITGNGYGVLHSSWSSNNTILGNSITDNTNGILLSSSPSNTVSENSIRNNGIGVDILSSFNTVSGNNITNNGSGVLFDMEKSSFNTVSGNNITNNYVGIGSQGGPSNNTISGNNIANNEYGIYLYSFSNNSITGNNVTNNNYGIWLYYSSGNSIFRNRFLNNTNQVSKPGYANTWDTGYPSGGNYWSDYTGVDFFGGTYQNVTGSDGIGDAPRVIDANNQDNYPLMYHWSPISAKFTYITSDGLIDPPTAPIHRVGDLYELTSDISDSIVVQRDNILINGRGYKVQGPGAPWRAPGIYLSNISNVTVKNAKIQDFGNGFVVKSIGKVVIEKNEIVGNSESGILIVGESDVRIEENIVVENKNGITTDTTETHSGIAVEGNTILSNIENGIYLGSYGESSIYGGYNHGYIFNVTISSNDISLNGEDGIHLSSYGGYSLSSYEDYGEGYGYIFNVSISSNRISSNRGNGVFLSSESRGSQAFSYVYGVTIESNNISSNEGNGTYLLSHSNGPSCTYSSYQSHSEIYDVRLTSNSVMSNKGNGIYLYSLGDGYSTRSSNINEITLLSNNVVLNDKDGIALFSSSYSVGSMNPGWGDQGQGSSQISNVRFVSNNVSLNNGNGIYLYGHGYGFGYGSGFGSVYNVTLSSNTVRSNKENGIYLYGQGYSEGYSGPEGYGWGDGSVYNVTFSFNDVSLNDGDGVYIHGHGYGSGHDYGPGYGYIHHITLLSENLSMNGGNGLNLYSCGYSSSYMDAYAYGDIHNIILISCRISSNGRIGVCSYSDSYASSSGDGYGYSYSYTYDFSLVSNTILSNNENGIYVKARDHHAESIFDLTMSGNIVYANNQKGMWIDGGIDANLTCNSISHNGYGIYLSQSHSSTIFHNNFIGNTIQAYAQDSTSIWDNGYPSGGNFWDDYVELDINGDFIGDTHYVINDNNEDRYPLIAPYGPIPIVRDETIYPVELRSNSTISKFRFGDPQRTISFNVTGADGTLGFCNLTIPNSLVQDLWQGNFTVLVDGKEPFMISNWTDSTCTYIYFTYTHSIHEVIIIQEFPSFLVLSLFMITTLLAVIVSRRKHAFTMNRG